MIYRSNLLWISIFCLNILAANAQQKDLVLIAVSVDTVFPQKISLSWEYEPNADSVTIYKLHPDQNYYKVGKVVMEMEQLRWTDETLNSVTTLNTYRIGWRESGMGLPQSNMVLKIDPPQDECPNSVALSWNPYVNMKNSLEHYRVLYRKKNADPLNFFSLFSTTNQTSCEVTKLACNTIYEFVIQAINTDGTVSAFSNIKEFLTGSFEETRNKIQIIGVGVIDDKYVEIDVVAEDLYGIFQQLNIQKGVLDDTASFNTFDMKLYDPKNEYFFVDEYGGTKRPHYLAIAENKCKLNDSSNVLSYINLSGHRDKNEKYKDSLFFDLSGIAFDPSNSYELFRLVNNIEVPITTFTVYDDHYYIDVTPFIIDGTAVRYQIKTKYNGKYYFSNTLTIMHEPILYFPSAFYPNSLNNENKTFYPIFFFPPDPGKGDTYLFTIYNRWGQEMFRSTMPPINGEFNNLQGRWDGTFKGKDCPSEFYTYHISYSFNDKGGHFSKTGSFMLVR